jgi:hypothetical protein
MFTVFKTADAVDPLRRDLPAVEFRLLGSITAPQRIIVFYGGNVGRAL